MSELSKAYEPGLVEDKWYSWWLDQGLFRADPASAKPGYSMVIPPPNVTGVLTLGHVLNNTIQDILARHARQTGHEVLWLPGTDHAGIATQTVVERRLRKEEKKTRHDLGREEFLERVWEWKEKHGGIIINQLKKLGCSCDWERERFTMDEDYSRCVQRIFVDLYNKGLIYRGKRMVNWCPVSLTALSDEEVIMKPQSGVLYYFNVEVVEKEAPAQRRHPPVTHLTIATTRPETIPGDTAIAVNPKDERYAHLIGKHVRRPLPVQIPDEQKLIPIIGDEHVDFEFGTGVLKVTPAHDKADFEIWGRQMKRMLDARQPVAQGQEALPAVGMSFTFPEVIDERGCMTSAAGESLVGLDRFEARSVAVDHLRELGALVKEEPYQNNVGFSERADVPIEPRLSEQWFLKYPKTAEARACILGRVGVPPAEAGILPVSSPAALSGGTPDQAGGTPTLPGMRFFPDRWEKVYDHWIENIQDWCISRQLWWGHRIPAWRRENVEYGMRNEEFKATAGGGTTTSNFQIPNSEFIVSTESPGEGWEQDPDVLDTWFSSWLWPFATMGWTGDKENDAKNATLAKFYPTTDLVTGPDIIFFWVARMIMAGLEWMGDIPFRNVYFTGIIRDKQGRKMSKSLGNSPDPLDIIEKYGADGLRFGLMRIAPQGQDIKFDEQQIVEGRNFCNKLWNACRFRLMQGAVDPAADPSKHDLSIFARDLLAKLDATIRRVDDGYGAFRFSDIAQALYDFVWGDFCDRFIEAAKADFDSPRREGTLSVMDFTILRILKLLHPYTPFITEELWSGLGFGAQSLMETPWPVAGSVAPEPRADAVYSAVSQARNLRATYNIPSNKRLAWQLAPAAEWVREVLPALSLFLHSESLALCENAPAGFAACPTDIGILYLPLEGVVDAAAERRRLQGEIEKVEAEIGKAAGKLSSETFVKNAPPAIVAEHRQRQQDWLVRLAELRAAVRALG